ncbi:DUF4190 domain-containing protein [Streptomyces sp. NPDC058382]|uniref:DUF4190 domain-containing protein n=1 Tax=unclassified Streptomyces TaxID=2593676 RepID=UPI003627402D
MSDNTERPVDGAASRDPWAPPDSRVPLDKKDAGETGPSTVHDQQTVTSMPASGTDPVQDAAGQPGAGTGPVPTVGFGAGPEAGQPSGPGGWYGPGTVPPPPVGPHGPGQQGPPPHPGQYAGQYGYPAPAAPQPGGQYGYPAAPGPQYGEYPGYPGYPGYGQNAWGPQPANGLGVAALVLGIIAVAGFCAYGLGVILGVLALIFGLIGRGRVNRGEADNGGMALAGIILGSIGIVFSGAFLGLVIWAWNNDDFDEHGDTGYEPTSAALVIDAPVVDVIR